MMTDIADLDITIEKEADRAKAIQRLTRRMALFEIEAYQIDKAMRKREK